MPTIKKSVRRPWQPTTNRVQSSSLELPRCEGGRQSQPERKAQEGRIHSNTKFYQLPAWRKLRALKLEQNPLCEECGMKAAKVADHKIPINQGGEPLDINNLQSLCHTCHNRKSGREAHTRNHQKE